MSSLFGPNRIGDEIDGSGPLATAQAPTQAQIVEVFDLHDKFADFAINFHVQDCADLARSSGKFAEFESWLSLEDSKRFKNLLDFFD